MLRKKALAHLYLLLAASIIALSACNNRGVEKQPDAGTIKVTLESYRLDEDLYAIDTNHIGEGLQQLTAKYPSFLNFYLDTIMGFNIHGNCILR